MIKNFSPILKHSISQCSSYQSMNPSLPFLISCPLPSFKGGLSGRRSKVMHKLSSLQGHLINIREILIRKRLLNSRRLYQKTSIRSHATKNKRMKSALEQREQKELRKCLKKKVFKIFKLDTLSKLKTRIQRQTYTYKTRKQL